MKIIIVGPGAMGCLFAAFLSKSGERVFLLDKNGKRAEGIRKNGIYIERTENSFRARDINIVTGNKEAYGAELIIIATKSYNTEEAVKAVLNLIGKESLVLTLQNGLGNIDTICKYVPRCQVIAGVTAEGATLLGEGHVRHAGRGETSIGKIFANKNSKTEARIREIVRIFNKAGFETRISADVKKLIWSKLIINTGINALTAITSLRNGKLIEFEWTRQVMKEAVNEAVKVARRKKIELDYLRSLKMTEAVCRLTAKNVSSMLQDVLKKRRTEINFINGSVVEEGRKFGISTPVNAVLTYLVKTIE
ncbi:MAG: 2-dehydropantoate 2-reductase, partial [Candidatus Omnitrophica bacterium]|nr:2-dehydropantoate 2-reductase [Candidatus Omnitrophota bacterium]